MIYVVGIALFVVSFLLLIVFIDWWDEMDFRDEQDDDRDEWRGK